MPASKQMVAVSATYPEFLANALARYMRDPTFVRLNSSDPSLLGAYRYRVLTLLACATWGLSSRPLGGGRCVCLTGDPSPQV